MELVRYKNTLEQNQSWDSGNAVWQELLEDARLAINEAGRSILSARTEILNLQLDIMTMDSKNLRSKDE